MKSLGSRITKGLSEAITSVAGGEALILEAVKDMLDELRHLRRENQRLLKENDKLYVRLEKATGRPRPASAATVRAVARSPRRSAVKSA